ncbi:MAG: TonB-dependent receptor, partial [bacterium]|nr:TonB-dependent receptor [bacterium]
MCKKYVIPVVLMFVLSALPFSLYSTEDSETAPMFTEEVEVVGNVPVSKAIQSVCIYKAEEIEKYNFESLKSVLKLTPGLLTLSNGRFGQSSSTTIRGSRSTQVLYIVDGIKSRDKAGIGGVNLSVLSPNVIDKVEVVRGPLSNIYGSDAMGGVISMNTFAGDGANFLASLGSPGSYTGNFAGGLNFRDVTLGVSV